MSSIAIATVTRYNTSEQPKRLEVAAPAERMRSMRERRRKRGLRELRLVVPNSRLQSVRRRVAAQISRLNPSSEEDALRWIEAVADLDGPDSQAGQ
jgi:hypothetical protein